MLLNSGEIQHKNNMNLSVDQWDPSTLNHLLQKLTESDSSVDNIHTYHEGNHRPIRMDMNTTISQSETTTLLIHLNASSSSSMRHQQEVNRYVATMLFLITFIFGLIGNTLTILVIVKNNKIKTVASCFILNLAIADCLFIFSLPFMAYSTFFSNWIFGGVLCKVLGVFRAVNLYASIFTMVLMSVDRYLAIVHPLKSMRYRTVNKAFYVCIALWLCCSVIMMPHWLYETARTKEDGTHSCKLRWPTQSFMTHRWFWTYFELTVGFIVPIIVMALCYISLLWNLFTMRQEIQEQNRRSIRRVTLMVFIVTVVFVVCWTPHHIVQFMNVSIASRFMRTQNRPSPKEQMNTIIMTSVSQALIFISSCVNPFIYAISSRNFRKLYLAAVCKCCAPRSKPTFLLPPSTQSKGPARNGSTHKSSASTSMLNRSSISMLPPVQKNRKPRTKKTISSV